MNKKVKVYEVILHPNPEKFDYVRFMPNISSHVLLNEDVYININNRGQIPIVLNGRDIIARKPVDLEYNSRKHQFEVII